MAYDQSVCRVSQGNQFDENAYNVIKHRRTDARTRQWEATPPPSAQNSTEKTSETFIQCFLEFLSDTVWISGPYTDGINYHS